jgi:DNA polymerase-3 subunit gamma/tau
MSYTVLARKYRPQRFSDVIGQDHVTRTLRNALEQQRIAHGYIFSGHRGIGKTTIARILAMALNCRSAAHPVPEPCGVCDSCREIREGSVGAMDVIEIDAASNRGIDEVRGLIATATAEPARDRYRIFILDEAHQVTDAAFNALLKTLEEPPPWAVFMMATTQPEDIPQTIRSRCQHFSFHAVRFLDIVEQLRSIAQQEHLGVDDDALALLAEAGDGSMRDALSIMDQAIACCGQTLTSASVRELVGTIQSTVLEQVMIAVHDNHSEAVLGIIDKLLVEGQSPAHFARQMVGFLRNALVAKVAGPGSSLLQISSDEQGRVARIAALFGEEDLTRFLQLALRTYGDVSYKQEQRFQLELGMLKLVHAQRLLPLEQLLSQSNLSLSLPLPAGGRSGGGTTSSPSRPPAAPSRAPGTSAGTASRTASNSNDSKDSKDDKAQRPSPFELDRARHSGGGGHKAEMRSASSIGSIGSLAGGQQAAAVAVFAPEAPPDASPINPRTVDLESVRHAVLAALKDAGQHMAADTLEEGEWSIAASGVTVKVSSSEQMIAVAFGPEQRRLMQQALESCGGASLRLSVTPGAAKNGAAKSGAASALSRPSSPEGARAKAAQHPVVRRMMEKFGAELRAVRDQE